MGLLKEHLNSIENILSFLEGPKGLLRHNM